MRRKEWLVLFLLLAATSGPMQGAAHAELSVKLIGLEVTQSIQAIKNSKPAQYHLLNNSVPLVAGKATMVRAYFKADPPSQPIIISATLKGSRSDGTLLPPLDSRKARHALPHASLKEMRADLLRGLLFKLPDDWTAEGDLYLEIVNVRNEFNEEVQCSNCPNYQVSQNRSIRFIKVPPLKLKLVRFEYLTEGGRHVPPYNDIEAIRSWLRRVYPISELEIMTAVEPLPTSPSSCDTTNGRLSLIRDEDFGGSTNKLVHYIGLVAESGLPASFAGCASSVPGPSGPPSVATALSGPDLKSPSGTKSDWYVGHELGHTLGLRHYHCGTNEDIDMDAEREFPQGLISKPDNNHVGMDTGDWDNEIPKRALDGRQWHDVMSYCSNKWMHTYSYRKILCRILKENGQGDRTCPGSQPTASQPGMPGAAPAGPSRVGGPDREKAPVSATPSEDYLKVIAIVDFTEKKATIESVKQVVIPPPIEVLEKQSEKKKKKTKHEHQVAIHLTIKGLAPIPPYPVEVKQATDTDVEKSTSSPLRRPLRKGEKKLKIHKQALVEALIPLPQKLAAGDKVDLQVCDNVMTALVVSEHAPVVRSINVSLATRMVQQAGGFEHLNTSLTFWWVANDEDPGTTLEYTVQMSVDDGETWDTIAVRYRFDSFVLPPETIQPYVKKYKAIQRSIPHIRIKVIASDGFNRGELISDRVESPRR